MLTAMGFEVLSRPMVGTRQYGADIATAVGDDTDGVRKLFLFSVKRGDLNRTEWNGASDQALRPSLDEIKDAYLNGVAPEHEGLPVVIVIAIGGVILENVQPLVNGFMRKEKTPTIAYRVCERGHADRQGHGRRVTRRGLSRRVASPSSQGFRNGGRARRRHELFWTAGAQGRCGYGARTNGAGSAFFTSRSGFFSCGGAKPTILKRLIVPANSSSSPAGSCCGKRSKLIPAGAWRRAIRFSSWSSCICSLGLALREEGAAACRVSARLELCVWRIRDDRHQSRFI